MSASCIDVAVQPMDQSKMCAACQGPIFTDPKHNAAYCPGCNQWLADACSDERCRWCAGRPVRPVVVKNPHW